MDAVFQDLGALDRGGALDERDIQAPGFAFRGIAPERHGGSLEAVEAGQAVDQGHVDLCGYPGAAGVDRHEAGHRLGDGVAQGALRVGARQAEAGDGDEDDPRIDVFQRLEADPEAVGDAGAIVVDHHVTGCRELEDDVDRTIALQIEAEAFLAAIIIDETSRQPVIAGAQYPHPVAGRWFDLQDLGAVFREQRATMWAGDALAHVEDAQAFEGFRRWLHRFPHIGLVRERLGQRACRFRGFAISDVIVACGVRGPLAGVANDCLLSELSENIFGERKRRWVGSISRSSKSAWNSTMR